MIRKFRLSKSPSKQVVRNNYTDALFFTIMVLTSLPRRNVDNNEWKMYCYCLGECVCVGWWGNCACWYFSERTFFISNFAQKSRFKASTKESLEKARVYFLGVAEPVDLGLCPNFKTLITPLPMSMPKVILVTQKPWE